MNAGDRYNFFFCGTPEPRKKCYGQPVAYFDRVEPHLQKLADHGVAVGMTPAVPACGDRDHWIAAFQLRGSHAHCKPLGRREVESAGTGGGLQSEKDIGSRPEISRPERSLVGLRLNQKPNKARYRVKDNQREGSEQGGLSWAHHVSGET